MPNKVRIISRRNSRQWDDLVADVLSRGLLGQENTYCGITNAERADDVRRHIRTAGKHHQVGSKVFWYECKGCRDGGQDCRYHVSYTLYDLAEARKYKTRQAQKTR